MPDSGRWFHGEHQHTALGKGNRLLFAAAARVWSARHVVHSRSLRPVRCTLLYRATCGCARAHARGVCGCACVSLLAMRKFRPFGFVAHDVHKLSCTTRGCREPCAVQFSSSTPRVDETNERDSSHSRTPLASEEKDRLHFARSFERVRAPLVSRSGGWQCAGTWTVVLALAPKQKSHFPKATG